MKKHILLTFILTITIISLFAVAGACFADTTSDLQHTKDLYQSGDFDGALNLLSGSVSADSTTSAEVLKLTGYCYRAKADVVKALEYFTKLTDTYPNSPIITQDVKDNLIGLNYYVAHDKDNGITYFRAMAVKYPDESLIWRYLAGDLLRTKELASEALVEYLKAWDQPSSQVNREWEAKVKVQIDTIQMFSDFDKMVSDAKSAVSKNPDDIAIWRYVLGYGYMCKGNYSDAIAELEPSVYMLSSGKTSCSKQGLVWRTAVYTLCYTLEKDKQYDKALAFYKKVAKAYPQYWKAHYGIFICLSKQDNFEEASTYINKVINDQPAIRDRLRELLRNYLLNEAS